MARALAQQGLGWERVQEVLGLGWAQGQGVLCLGALLGSWEHTQGSTAGTIHTRIHVRKGPSLIDSAQASHATTDMHAGVLGMWHVWLHKVDALAKPGSLQVVEAIQGVFVCQPTCCRPAAATPSAKAAASAVPLPCAIA